MPLGISHVCGVSEAVFRIKGSNTQHRTPQTSQQIMSFSGDQSRLQRTENELPGLLVLEYSIMSSSTLRSLRHIIIIIITTSNTTTRTTTSATLKL